MRTLIEKEAKSGRMFLYPRHYTASARAAFIHILSYLKEKSGKKIILPAYIGLSQVEGSGVFDPIRATGTGYGFYRVGKDLTPDLEDLRKKLATGEYGAVFLIHYFGFPQTNVSEFAKICRQEQALLVEDCAHTIEGGLKEPRLGTFGDFSIFSIHKSTSSMDGGFYYDQEGFLAARPLPEELRIPLASLEVLASTDLRGASERRRELFRQTLDFLKGYPQIRPFYRELDDCVVPLNCPVLVGDGARERLYFKLRDRGVWPTSLYHTLIPEISRDEFPDSYAVADSILNLPIHQDIDDSSFESYLNILKIALDEIFREEKGQ